MEKRVLVAYATKYGATAEIARKIGEVLRQSGLPTDVKPASKVLDVEAYDAVVLGSAVYIGKWRKQAVKFLEAYQEELAEIPVWIFSSGPTGTGDVVELLEGWKFPKSQKPVADRIKPRDMVVFHGSLNLKKLNFIERWMIKNINAPVGDFRDWNVVTVWATTIANDLKGVTPTLDTEPE